MDASPEAQLAQYVWATRFRDPEASPPECGIEDTWVRVAGAASAVERDSGLWRSRFLDMLDGFRFLPGGRILAGAGTGRHVTLLNCFVMGLIEDSIPGIFEALKEGALTLQQGGGVGYDFSTLRPRGTVARATGAVASGPVSFLHVWDAMCATLLSTRARRGAMMATLRCDHPDIEEFVTAKLTPGMLPHFNLSVLVTDEFMQAVRDDGEWRLMFPENTREPGGASGEQVWRAWSGGFDAVTCRVHKVVAARELWERLCKSAHSCAEPGVLFIDRINAANNLGYCETLSATNPCGETPLPPYGGCDLGSINLATFVLDPFSESARFDFDAIRATAAQAVRFLDDILDVSRFPLPRQRQQAQRSRRIGLGITGLADALTMLALRYDSEAARACAGTVMQTIRNAAYATSVELAREKGAFSDFRAEPYLERPMVRSLPQEVRTAIRRFGIRNSHLTAIAPAATISLLAHGVSSGIEPVFGIESVRHVTDIDGTDRLFHTASYACTLWRSRHGRAAALPAYFVDAGTVSARDQLLMLAALQSNVDGGISKTIALPREAETTEVSQIFRWALDLDLKGCTVYRAGTRTAVIESRPQAEVPAGPCCEAARNDDRLMGAANGS